MVNKGPEPTILVILGVTGDLSHRYLLPALTELQKNKQLPKDLKILGVSRRQITSDEVFNDKTAGLAKYTDFFQMDFDQPSDYRRLAKKLHKSEDMPKPQVIFYFAVPPDAVPDIIERLAAAGLNSPNVKLLLEKPFGKDLESARKLVARTAKCFRESQLYRIDHYLAKEVAQNISIFLSSNTLFRNVWNKDFIEYIEIVVAEQIGVEGRGNFYEQTGALRDIVQSHLLQLAALTLMESCPDPFDFSDLPGRRLAALKAMHIVHGKIAQTLFRAQYKGYRQDVGNPDSTTETFVALQVNSANPRWEGVPVYLATGKKLDQKLSQIRVNFKKTSAAQANMLVIRIQPDEGIELDLWVKKPGYEKELEKKILSFSFSQNFDRLPDAYEQVLIDAIRSDQSLFAASQEIIASWEVAQPALDYGQKHPDELHFYQPGCSIEQILNSKSAKY